MPAGQSSERIGLQIGGRYELVRLIAEGGMGSVFEAWHLQLQRRVAVKMLRTEFLRDADSVERFLQEARAAAAIGHPSIVEIFDFGQTEDGAPYIVMAYLEGESLADRLYRSGRIDEATAVRTLLPILWALDRAHAQGIIHRDLKPENVFMARTPEGGEKSVLVDFGVSKFQGGSVVGHSSDRVGEVLGTPAYMSPEQAGGSATVDARTDVYSMGAMFYELLTGAAPYQRDDYNATLAAILREPPRPMSRIVPTVSPAMEAAVACAMARNPHDRFQTMAEFGRVLEEVLAAPAAGGPLLQHHDVARSVLSARAATPGPDDGDLPGAELADEREHTIMVMSVTSPMAEEFEAPVLQPPAGGSTSNPVSGRDTPGRNRERAAMAAGIGMCVVGVAVMAAALWAHGRHRAAHPTVEASPPVLVPAPDAGAPESRDGTPGIAVPTPAAGGVPMHHRSHRGAGTERPRVRH